MAKIRWIRQYDQYSCGGVALVNVLKWLSYPATYSLLPALRKLCKCSQPKGTGQRYLEAALRKLGIQFKRKTQPTIREIDRHLDSGGIVLVHYYIVIGHYSLCVGRNKDIYTMVNDIDDVTVSELHRNDLKYRLEWSFDGLKRWTWFVFPGVVDEAKVKRVLND